eukprot:Sspe_Gene.62368::Locus_34977_Transcript_1_1_Confidence_1.000_Length_1467::g.62368::m.62368
MSHAAVVLGLLALLPSVQAGDCGAQLKAPTTWVPAEGTFKFRFDFLYTWTKVRSIGGYECSWDVAACFWNFVDSDDENDICNTQCPSTMPKIKRIVCIGKAVKNLFRGTETRCYGYAEAMDEVLSTCEIPGDVVSAYDVTIPAGHSWNEIRGTVKDTSNPPKEFKMIIDVRSDTYALIPVDSTDARRFQVLEEEERELVDTEDCTPPILDGACQSPSCGEGKETAVRVTSRTGFRTPTTGVGADTPDLLLGVLPMMWVPTFLQVTTYHHLPGLKNEEALEMQCCHASGCAFYIVVYKCPGCTPRNGNLPQQLLGFGWEAKACGPRFSCNGFRGQPTTVFRKYAHPMSTERIFPVEGEAAHIGVFSVPREREYMGGLQWCPPPVTGTPRAYGQPVCTKHCCP